HIRVRKTNEGSKYYGHTLSGVIDDMKIEPSARGSTDKSMLHSVNASGSAINIPQPTSDVNGNVVGADENINHSPRCSMKEYLGVFGFILNGGSAANIARRKLSFVFII
ncbi:MAG: hypothetical protein RSE10_08085, partial [Oscillospiraceae bacterium]